MSIKHITIVLAATVVLTGTWAVKADTLWTYQWTGEGGQASVMTGMLMTLWVYDDMPLGGPGLPGGITVSFPAVTPADIGSTVWIGADNEPNFDAFAAYLVDGANNYIFFDSQTWPGLGGSSVGKYESAWYGSTTSNGIDFEGSQVGSFSLTLNSMTLVSPGSNPNHDGIWTDYSYDATFTIEEIPEPATLSLLALGGLAMLRRRKLGPAN